MITRGVSQTLETAFNMKVTRGECVPPMHCPTYSLDKLTKDSSQEVGDQMNCCHSHCCQLPSDADCSDTSCIPPKISQGVMESVGAQLELLRHELFLAQKQVKERNKQIVKLERIIDNQKVELKHHCDGSSNLLELLYSAVDAQNKQVESMRDVKQRLISMEASVSVSHKRDCGLLLSSYRCGSGNLPTACHCNTTCHCNCQTAAKSCKNPNSFALPVTTSGSEVTKAHKTTITEAISETAHGMNSSHSDERLNELEKQKMINCQLNEHLMKLQEEIKLLKLKIEKYEENKVAALKTSSLFEKEKQRLTGQISVLTKQNSKLQGHVSQIDRERDRAVRELNSSDEIISKMGVEVHRVNAEARKLECQLKTATTRCGKLEDLLENSEKLTTSLRKQKSQLESDLDRISCEMESAKKSFELLRSKYKKTSNNFHVYKKKMWKANEEKVILQSQIQEYVSRVRHIEDLLLQKEQEREFIFQQFQQLTAKDTCRNDFLDETVHKMSPSLDGSRSDSVYIANAETQTAELKEPGDSRCNISRKSFQEQAYNTNPLSSDQEAINTTHDSSVSKKGKLTSQFNIMGKTVQSLESRVQMIGKSLENCQKKCTSQEQRASRRFSAESSLSTML